MKRHVWRGGTKQIPFDADAPEGSTIICLCDNPDLPDRKGPGVIVREVVNNIGKFGMLSKYVYFQVNS